MKLVITLNTNDKSAQWSETYVSPNIHAAEQTLERAIREYNATVSDVGMKLAYTVETF